MQEVRFCLSLNDSKMLNHTIRLTFVGRQIIAFSSPLFHTNDKLIRINIKKCHNKPRFALYR